MNDATPPSRLGAPPQALYASFEKAGLTLTNQPIPWCADAVLVEAYLRLPTGTPRDRQDFLLHLPEQAPIAAESLHAEEHPQKVRVFFRLPTPAQTTTVEVFWKQQSLGRLELALLTRQEFSERLSVQLPTVAVTLGACTVACQSYVATQCRGLAATALIGNATSLVPLLDLDLHVELRNERTSEVQRLPIHFASSQLRGKQALATVTLAKPPRRTGVWQMSWLLDERPLARLRLKTLTKRQFVKSLRVADVRYIVQAPTGALTLQRQPPAQLPPGGRLGPCFLLAGSEAGMAGLCKVQARACVANAVQPPLLQEQELLITDGLTPFAPGTLDAGELQQVQGFTVTVENVPLGTFALTAAPSAVFDREGSFVPPPEFRWSAAAEEQLLERLGRLFEQPNTARS